MIVLSAINVYSQCPGGGTPSAINLIINGDFSAGNSGFTTGYSYCNTGNCLWAPPTNGGYSIGNSAPFFHTNFVGTGHTNPTGPDNFYIANGDVLASNPSVWCQTVTVQPNKTYLITAWVTTVSPATPPAELQFKINGTSIGSILAPNNTSPWVQFSGTWNSNAATSAALCIYDLEKAASGNDFGLDDIEFRECAICSLNVTAGPDTSLCQGQTVILNATASNPSTFSWLPITNLSNPNIANPIAFPFSTTTYTVTALDATGCTKTATVNIQVSPNPIMNAPANTTVCEGESVLLIPNSTGALSWNWSPSGSLSCSTCQGPYASPTVTTTYTVTATNAGSCTRIDSVTVTVVPKPTVNAGPDIYRCNNTSSVQLNAIYTGTSALQTVLWAPPTNLAPTNALNPFANPSVTTTYTITVTDVNGCQDKDTLTIFQNAVAADAGPDTALCQAGTVTLNAVQNPGFTYSWTPANLVNPANTASTVASPTVTTTFTLTVTDANNCTGTDEVTVFVSSPPPIDAGSDVSICLGETVQLQGSGGINLLWQTDPSLSCTGCPNPIASPLTTTKYYLTGEDVAGCTNIDSVIVTVNPGPTVNVTQDDTICIGGSINLVATGAPNWLWSPSGSLSCTNCSGPTATPTVQTTYKVIGTNNFGCKDSNEVTIYIKPGPAVTINNDTTVCVGGSAQLLISGASNYQWAPPTGLSCTNCPNPVSTPLANIKYYVTATDNIGCPSIDSVSVSVTTAPNITITGDSALCIGGSVLWTASGGANYQWAPNTNISCINCNNPVLNPSVTTVYTLTTSAANGCSAGNVTRTLIVNPLPDASVAPAGPFCPTDPLYPFNPTTIGGTFSGTGVSGSSFSPALAGPGIHSITYNIVDQNGCANSSVFTVTVSSVPNITISPDMDICIGDTAQLNGSGPGSYQWSSNGYMSCTSCPNPKVAPTVNTKYYLTVFNAIGCDAYDSVIVSVNQLPDPSVAPAGPFCPDDPPFAFNPATPGGIYTGTGITGNNFNPAFAGTGSHTIFYNVTDVNGCANSSAFSVTVNALPNVGISPDTSICNAGSVQLNATGGITYKWSPASTLNDPDIANPVATPIIQTIYTVTVTDANGCSGFANVTVNITAPLPVNAGPDTSICPGQSVQLFASNGLNYTWTPISTLSNPNIANPVSTPTSNITYIVTITDLNGCQNTGQVNIQLNPNAQANAGFDQTIYEGQQVQLHGSGGVSFSWVPANLVTDSSVSNPFTATTDTTTYILTVADANGCMDFDSVTVWVIRTPHVYMPNAFTPNGDGKNDEFGVGYDEAFDLNSLMIFNRWGELIFHTNDPNGKWDGTINGQIAPMDTYIYLVNGYTTSDVPVTRQGNVILIR